MTVSADDIPIDQVAAITGVKQGTMRQWEARYGWPTPHRLPNGYRVFSPGQVQIIKEIARLLRTGYKVTQLIVNGIPKWPDEAKARPVFKALRKIPIPFGPHGIAMQNGMVCAIERRAESEIIELLHSTPIQVPPTDRENATWLPALIGCAEWRVIRPLHREPEIHDAIHRQVSEATFDWLWYRAAHLMKVRDADR